MLITAVKLLEISKGLRCFSKMLMLTGNLLLFLWVRWSGSLLVVRILRNPLLVFYNFMLIQLGSPLFLQGMGHKITFFMGKQTVLRGATELALASFQSIHLVPYHIELVKSSLIKYYRDKENVSWLSFSWFWVGWYKVVRESCQAF